MTQSGNSTSNMKKPAYLKWENDSLSIWLRKWSLINKLKNTWQAFQVFFLASQLLQHFSNLPSITRSAWLSWGMLVLLTIRCLPTWKYWMRLLWMNWPRKYHNYPTRILASGWLKRAGKLPYLEVLHKESHQVSQYHHSLNSEGVPSEPENPSKS